MAKKKKKVDISEFIDSKYESVDVGTACTEYMKIFGANANLLRQIPMLVDGLKPVERRLLFTMFHDLKLRDVGKKDKVAKIIGYTLTYHPHGETSVYEALVRMGQPWNNNITLIDGEGNYGNTAGDSAGAARYIEARLSKFAKKCFFDDFTFDAVDCIQNATNSGLEPEYLPSKYPYILINNSFGIGYGISCGIPPYNLKEALETTINLIDNPDADINLVPDIPTGADIVYSSDIDDIISTGEGTIKLRAVIDIDESTNCLSIKNVPLLVNFMKVLTKINELKNEGVLKGISSIEDCTEGYDLDFKMYLKKEVDIYDFVNTLYKRTYLQKSLSVRCKLIDEYQDVNIPIRGIINNWVEFRIDTKRRIYNKRYVTLLQRQHELETLLYVINDDNIEKTHSIVKNSEDADEMIENLVKEFGISSLQATSMSKLRFVDFSKSARKKLAKESSDIVKELRKVTKMVKNIKHIKEEIKEELLEGIELFGKERISKVIKIDESQVIRDTQHIIVITNNGMVKKLPVDVKNIGAIAEGDFPTEVLTINNRDDILLFDEFGRVSRLPVSIIPNSVLKGHGSHLSSFTKIQGKVVSVMAKPTEEFLNTNKAKDVFFVMVSRDGIIKKSHISEFMGIKTSLISMKLRDKDRVVSVKAIFGDKDIVIYDNKGNGIRYSSTEVKETSRASIGVKAMDIIDGGVIAGFEFVNPKETYLFMITKKGFAKKSTLEHFPTQLRTDKPLKLIRVDDGDELLLLKTVIPRSKFVLYTNSTIAELNLVDIEELSRMSKGKKAIAVKRGDNIIDIKEKR